MQDEPSRAEPSDGGRQPGGSADEWAEIARRIEQQIRRDAARVVGVEPSADWASIRDGLFTRVRDQADEIDRTEVGRRVSEVGRELDERLRSGLGQAAGAGPDADWATIGRTVRQRVESVLDPTVPPPPGGSGTGASAEDAAVPSAPPSPDGPARPAAAGGEDTGQPTVVDETGEPPTGPPPDSPRPPTAP